MVDELSFIIETMKQGYNTEPNALSFIPNTKVEQYYIPRGQYLIQTSLRGLPVGYILHGNMVAGGHLTIAQAIVDIDKRNLAFGEQMIAQLIERAQKYNVRLITLRCAANLDSNAFWKSQGFTLTGVDKSPNKRKRFINLYSMYLWPTLFQDAGLTVDVDDLRADDDAADDAETEAA